MVIVNCIMCRALVRAVAVMLLGVAAGFAVFACCSVFAPGRPVPQTREPRLTVAGGADSLLGNDGGEAFGWSFRYQIGNKRDEILRELSFGGRLVASASRPCGGWALWKNNAQDWAYTVTRFMGQRSDTVATCDVYEAGEFSHVLFFDDSEVLIGFQRIRRFICLTSADYPAAVTPAIAISCEAGGDWCRVAVRNLSATQERRTI